MSLKSKVERATHRVVPYLFLCEAVSALWLYRSNPFFVTRYWWYFIVLGFGSLISLVILEHRRGLPLPFVNRLTAGDSVVVFLLAATLPIMLIVLLESLVYPILHKPLTYVSYYNLALCVSAGITEESFKVGLTNAVAMTFQWPFRKKRSEWLNRLIVCLAGLGSVALWAWMHVPLAHFTATSVPNTFVAGVVYFLLILWKKNYLPVVFGHAFHNSIFLPVVRFSLVT